MLEQSNPQQTTGIRHAHANLRTAAFHENCTARCAPERLLTSVDVHGIRKSIHNSKQSDTDFL